MKRNLFKEIRLDDLPFDEEPLPPKRVPINYEKLVVPTRMRSSYWKYFGFPADGDGKMITKDVIVCVLCKSQMVYNRNTSNLKMHLGSRHKNTLRNIETRDFQCDEVLEKYNSYKTYDISNIDIQSTSKCFEDFKNEEMIVAEDIYDTDVSIIYPSKEDMPHYEPEKSICESIESTAIEIDDAIVNFLITDLVSPKIVEGKGFHNFISTLASTTLEIPNERKITEDIIPNLYRRHKDCVFETILSNLDQNISLSLEQWTCVDNSSCLSVYLYYLSNEEQLLNSKLLTSVSFTGDETVEFWNNYLDILFTEWNISTNSISAVLVAFYNEALKEALKKKHIVLLPCFLFTVQNICSEYCFKQPVVFELLEKCRALIRYIQENKVELAEDEDEFVDADGDENDFLLSCDQRDMWLTTYYMLRGVLRRKQAIINFLAIKSYVNPLSLADWRNLHHLIKCLEPIKTVILTLFEEKNPLISLVKPLIGQVCCNKFTTNQCDSVLIKQLKSNILKALNEAYKTDNIDSFIRTATKLDPRFKKLMEEDEENFENNLVSLLFTLVEEQGFCSQIDETKKPSRLSSINVLFGDNFSVEKQEINNELAVKMEVATYRSQNSALLEECPLEWWQGMLKKCPNLIKLSYRYHCVPAMTMLGSHFSLKNYIIFCSQRATLPVHIADSLLFLNINKGVYKN